MWKEFDAEGIRADFETMRSLNLRLVRLFLLWEDFQPRPDVVEERQLENLARTFELAEEAGLLLMPTLFVGHMSGPNWLPSWAISEERYEGGLVYVADGVPSERRPRDLYDDPLMLEAQRLLAETVVGRFRDQSALYGWDLCNEIDLVQMPETAEKGDRWLREMRVANLVLRLVDGKTERTFGNTCCDNHLGPLDNKTCLEELIPKLFVAARGEFIRRPVDPHNVNLAALGHYGADGKSFEQLRNEIESAVRQGKWIVYMFHGVGKGINQFSYALISIIRVFC